MRSCQITQEFSVVLRDDLEGWAGVGRGSEGDDIVDNADTDSPLVRQKPT